MKGDAWEDWNGNKVLMMMVKKENDNWKNIAKLMMVVTREKMKLEPSWGWQERKKMKLEQKLMMVRRKRWNGTKSWCGWGEKIKQKKIWWWQGEKRENGKQTSWWCREKMKSNNIVDNGKERRRGKMRTKFIMWCREKMKWEHKLDVDA